MFINAATFFEEIVCHCDEALDAIGRLNYALLNLYQVPTGGSRYEVIKAEIFDVIDVFLISTGCVSRMLWLDRNRQRSNHKEPQHDPDSTEDVLSSCGFLRKSLRMADRRLMRYLARNCPYPKSFSNRNIQQDELPNICKIIGSPLAFIDYPASSGIRIYDPMTRNLHADGRVYPLQEIASTITHLQKQALSERRKQETNFYSNSFNGSRISFAGGIPLS